MCVYVIYVHIWISVYIYNLKYYNRKLYVFLCHLRRCFRFMIFQFLLVCILFTCMCCYTAMPWHRHSHTVTYARANVCSNVICSVVVQKESTWISIVLTSCILHNDESTYFDIFVKSISALEISKFHIAHTFAQWLLLLFR